jgi:hypothetical protein
MGQYFLIVNTTKKEYLHPHRFGEGLKFMEFTLEGSGIMHGLAHLLAQSSEGVAIDHPEITGRWIGDHVVIVGDYDNSGVFDKAYESNDYHDISQAVIQHIGRDAYVQSMLSERHAFGGGEYGASVFINGASIDLPTLHPSSDNEYLGARA